ncbi:uncharacterized protein LOC131998531 isoform X2 [Stomoxys calcitrans]|nr:uncharacterized protein LOC131998531 isoform X2 [Stomoxys calcitrans]
MAKINISPQTIFSSSPELEGNQNSNANSTTSDQELCHSFFYKKGTEIKQDGERVEQVIEVQPHTSVGKKHKRVDPIICSPAKKIKCEIEDELRVVSQNYENVIDFQIPSQLSQDSCFDTNNKQNMTQRTMGSKSNAKSKDNYYFKHNITKRPIVHFGANSVLHLPHGKQMLYQEHRLDDVPFDLSVKKSRELMRETSITNNSTLKNSSNISVENTPKIINVDEVKLQIHSHMMGKTEAAQGGNKQVSLEKVSGKNKFSKNALDGSKESKKTCKLDAEVVADKELVVKAKKDILPKSKPQQQDISTKKKSTKAKRKQSKHSKRKHSRKAPRKTEKLNSEVHINGTHENKSSSSKPGSFCGTNGGRQKVNTPLVWLPHASPIVRAQNIKIKPNVLRKSVRL